LGWVARAELRINLNYHYWNEKEAEKKVIGPTEYKSSEVTNAEACDLS